MCGIFGVTVGSSGNLPGDRLRRLLDDLFVLSESRGKEAAGLAMLTGDKISVYKQPTSASEMIRTRDYDRLFAPIRNGDEAPKPLAVIGHSRLVTNGTQEQHYNNQPVISSGAVGIHNGIIVNDRALWTQHPALTRRYDVDTEVMLALLRYFTVETGSPIEGARQAFREIEGAASVALLFEDLNYLLLATNNGSLYVCGSNGIRIFASEEYILRQLLAKSYVRTLVGENPDIIHVEPGMGQLVDLSTGESLPFRLDNTVAPTGLNGHITPIRPIKDVTPNADVIRDVPPPPGSVVKVTPEYIRNYEDAAQQIGKLRRCTRCILPETMPFIEFDEQGVCNYCRSYRPIQTLGHDALMEAVDPYRRNDGKPDCLVTFSGGRDSSYGLHYTKTVLKMNPVAYSYDWGMITDLARRNQSRICGKLGIEHILVSADINRKRANIRKNVLAWLKQPDLGTVPLFMAGDKQYFYYANRLREQLGVKIVVFCENLLETTAFKSGFCGISPTRDDTHTYTMSLQNKAKMAAYYGKQYLTNPAYLNQSLLDTIGAFLSYYFIPHNYLNIFGYLRWEERTIIQPLRKHYDWELATDTNTTWRIGDGTASFYNYIYLMMAGFTENDTFRSNQIREGMITREQALATIEDENQPRWDSIQWYCDTIGIDSGYAIKTINAAHRLY